MYFIKLFKAFLCRFLQRLNNVKILYFLNLMYLALSPPPLSLSLSLSFIPPGQLHFSNRRSTYNRDTTLDSSKIWFKYYDITAFSYQNINTFQSLLWSDCYYPKDLFSSPSIFIVRSTQNRLSPFSIAHYPFTTIMFPSFANSLPPFPYPLASYLFWTVVYKAYLQRYVQLFSPKYFFLFKNINI